MAKQAAKIMAYGYQFLCDAAGFRCDFSTVIGEGWSKLDGKKPSSSLAVEAIALRKFRGMSLVFAGRHEDLTYLPSTLSPNTPCYRMLRPTKISVRRLSINLVFAKAKELAFLLA